MSRRWYIALASGGRQGPLSIDEVREALLDGRLRPETLVWAETMAEWAPAAETELAELFGALPPPLPPGARQGVAGGPGPFAAGTSSAAAGLVIRGSAGQGRAAPPLGFLDAIGSGFRNYVTFRGRASRSEYWYWTLFVMLISIAAAVLDGALGAGRVDAGTGSGVVSVLVTLAVLLPGLAVSTRRLHDIGRSGWWQLLFLVPLVGPIVLLVLYCTRPVVTETIYD